MSETRSYPRHVKTDGGDIEFRLMLRSDEAAVLAIEVGFHCENRDRAANDRELARLVAAEPTWRPMLGDEAVAGPFFGRPDDWRRLSETWADPDLGDPEIGMELGARLTDYLVALEPVRRLLSS